MSCGCYCVVWPLGLLAVLGLLLLALRMRYRSLVNGPFEATRYVWSRGLALLCDHNGGVSFVKGQRGGRPALRFDPKLFASVKEGDLVWVRLIALPQFLDEALPLIKARFALVTGDEDWAIPSGFPQALERVAAATRASRSGSRKTTTARTTTTSLPSCPSGSIFTPSATPASGVTGRQARRLKKRSSKRYVRARRPMHGDCCACMRIFTSTSTRQQVWGDDRAAVQRALMGNPDVQFQTRKVRRIELWREKTRYAFVVSPHGNGLDCHRTWESLVLGNIVIVKRSSLDPLYEGLPVVIVDDWRQITSENLKLWHAAHCAAFDQPEVQEKLTNAYWIARMRRLLAERWAGP